LRNPLAPLRTGVELLKKVREQPSLLDTIPPTMERQMRQLVTIDRLLNTFDQAPSAGDRSGEQNGGRCQKQCTRPGKLRQRARFEIPIRRARVRALEHELTDAYLRDPAITITMCV